MTTNGEIYESGRKRARTEEACSSTTTSSSSPAISSTNKKNKNKALPKQSASDIQRANKISNKLSSLLNEFPEVKFIFDFENLKASVEAAVVKYEEEKETKNHEAQLHMNYGQELAPFFSLPDEVLSKCLSYLGKGHYGSVALVSKKLCKAYVGEYGNETAFLEMATSINLARHCLNELCKYLGDKDEILKAAAVNGNLDILRAAVNDGYDLFPLVAMKKKTIYPDCDSDDDDSDDDSNEESRPYAVYYSEDDDIYCSREQKKVKLSRLIERGHLHVLEYLHEELNYFLGLQRYYKPAIQHGQLKILEWLEGIGIMGNNDVLFGFMDKYGDLNITLDYCECAIKSGSVESLKWLIEIGKYEINNDNSNVLVDAIRSKSTEMIQYLFDEGYNEFNIHNVEGSIKMTESVEVFRKMHELGYEFEDMNRWCYAYRIADSFEIIKFLRSISVPWDQDIMNDIIENGTVEMIQYAYEDGCPWTGEEYYHLSKSSSLSIDKLKYLKDNGCKFDYENPHRLIYYSIGKEKELALLDYFIGKNSSFDNIIFKEIFKSSFGPSEPWFEGITYLLEKGKDVDNFKSLEEVFRTRHEIHGIKYFHTLGLPWCLDTSRNTQLLSKIACYNDLDSVKWAYDNGCKGGNLVPYVKEEWEGRGIRNGPLWKRNQSFFAEKRLLDETFLMKSGIIMINENNVHEVGDAKFESLYSSKGKQSWFQIEYSFLKTLVEHGYTFMSEFQKEYVINQAFKNCCDRPQIEDFRKRLALFLRMGARDL